MHSSVLLSPSFGRGVPQDWSIDHPEWWSVANGHLRASLPDHKQRRSMAKFGSPDWRDVALQVDVCGVRGVDKGVVVRLSGDDGIGVDLRGEGYNDVLVYHGHTELAKTSFPNTNGRWYRVRVELRGRRIQVYVGRRLVVDADDSTHSKGGRMALAAYTGGAGACEVLFDHVRVISLDR